MLALMRERLLEVFKAIAPLTLLVTLLQVTVVRAPLSLFLQYLAGSALALIGMTLLLAGIDYGILPMGRYIGAALPGKQSLLLIAAVSFALGFTTTVAEPDVLVLAGQVDTASGGDISRPMVVYALGGGVGVFTVIAMLRIIGGWSMKPLLAASWLAAIGLSFFAPEHFVSLGFDGGSVTTGVLSTPVMIALAIGLSSVLAGRSSIADSFGLLGFASIGPILALLLLGLALS